MGGICQKLHNGFATSKLHFFMGLVYSLRMINIMSLTDDTKGSHHAKVDKEAQRHLLGELGEKQTEMTVNVWKVQSREWVGCILQSDALYFIKEQDNAQFLNKVIKNDDDDIWIFFSEYSVSALLNNIISFRIHAR